MFSSLDPGKLRRDTSKVEVRSLRDHLLSIAVDAKVVASICSEGYCNMNVIANLRCGAWYVDQRKNLNLEETISNVYFKSTDGHYGKWDISIKRLNWEFLSRFILSNEITKKTLNSAIIVDATRSGKRLPDSLSKTIPLWCCVINNLVRKLNRKKDNLINDWDTNLYLPPYAVSGNEKSGMEDKIDELVDKLENSITGIHDDIVLLKKPLRPFWVQRDSNSLPLSNLSKDEIDELPFYPLILISASKCVQDGVEYMFDSSLSSSSFLYIQGSADDEESWALGLTSTLYWKNYSKIINACNRIDDENDIDNQEDSADCSNAILNNVISSIVKNSIFDASDVNSHYTTVLPNIVPWLLIGDFHSAVSVYEKQIEDVDTIINCGCQHQDITKIIPNISNFEDSILENPIKTYFYAIPEGKKGRHELREKMKTILLLLIDRYNKSLDNSYDNYKNRILIHCVQGRDRSAACVIAFLSILFTLKDKHDTPIDFESISVSKTDVQRALIRLQSIWPRTMPSRASMRAITSVLCSQIE